MQFQVAERNGDYIVEAFTPSLDSPGGYWQPLRNFGDHQGDAIAFKEYDCPRLDDFHLRALIKNYNPAVRYSRISGTKFTKQ